MASLFLISALSADTPEKKAGPMEFALQLTLEKPVFEIDKVLWFKEHIEGLATLREAYRFRIDPATGKVLVSKVQDDGIATPDGELVNVSGDLNTAAGLTGAVNFGRPNNAALKPGEARGRILLRVRKRVVLD